MAPSNYEQPGFWRDIALAMYEHWSPSKTDLGQITRTAKVTGGWEITVSGLYIILYKMSDRTTWDEKAHLDLLMAVLNNITLTKEEWDKVLVELRTKGYSYTPSAANFPPTVPDFYLSQTTTFYPPNTNRISAASSF
ncbi:hypothetical protein VSDG_00737 [Cytospora chrysosperma]|uniref:Uncharacterized protein n=1 Tax=Cytospora chrysosperma TaxID=252740 RepID=A0A423WM58_CYTCH|nr:hypothetical protein VSDG_00737 [Valsa sordida]